MSVKIGLFEPQVNRLTVLQFVTSNPVGFKNDSHGGIVQEKNNLLNAAYNLSFTKLHTIYFKVEF